MNQMTRMTLAWLLDHNPAWVGGMARGGATAEQIASELNAWAGDYMPLKDGESLYSDLLRLAVGQVDFEEVAQGIIAWAEGKTQ